MLNRWQTIHVSEPRCRSGSPVVSGQHFRGDRSSCCSPWREYASTLRHTICKKQKYYELVAGAAAGCQPHLSNPHLNNTGLSKTIAETALKVVKAREGQATLEPSAISITDAYATVTMAYRRAAAIYVLDEELQQIGTAAVHLVTMANSYMAAAHSTDSTLASRQN